MSSTSKPKPASAPVVPTRPRWTDDELLRVKHLGPAIIGQQMYEAAQKVNIQTAGGVLGPAVLATSAEELEAMQAR